MPYSYGRRYIVAALAASDPTFGGDVAVECLWDCEAETRRLAATHVDRRVRLAAQRLEELADDDVQAASVRAAAAQRRGAWTHRADGASYPRVKGSARTD